MLEKFEVANSLLDSINGGGTGTMIKMSFSGMNAVQEALAVDGACGCSCGCSGGGGGGGAGGGEVISQL
jgi:hypothetical protein